jgi:hypothetical protein
VAERCACPRTVDQLTGRIARLASAAGLALGFFTHLAGEHAIAWSGGSEPAGRINAAAIAAMAERGIGGHGRDLPWGLASTSLRRPGGT